MRPTDHQLALRDPALAALMGALPGSDFGAEWERSRFGGDMAGEFGGGYPSGFGAEAAAAGLAHPDPSHPANQAAMVALFHQHKQRMLATSRRVAHLDPNKDSTVKIEGYSFTIAAAPVVLPVVAALAFNATGFPKTDIRPVRIIMNIPTVNFVYVQQIQVANVSSVVGVAEDAFKYSALAVGTQMSLPRMTPSTPATVNGTYSGLNPFAPATPYTLTISFEGPATVAGGGYEG